MPRLLTHRFAFGIAAILGLALAGGAGFKWW